VQQTSKTTQQQPLAHPTGEKEVKPRLHTIDLIKDGKGSQQVDESEMVFAAGFFSTWSRKNHNHGAKSVPH